MADPQVLSIDLGPLPAGASAFRLRFSADGEATWTNYSTTDPAGAVAEELPVSALTGTIYLLDGVNAPTGNRAAASAVGTVLEGAWKAGGLWSRWGPAAEAVVSPPAPGWPTHADVIAILYEGGRALPAPDAILEAGIGIELPRVIAYVEGPPAPDGTGGTGRSFTPTVEQRLFDGNYRNELDVFDLVPADQGGSAIAVVTMPGSVPLTGAPVPVPVRNGLTEGWDRLALQWDGAAALPRFPLGRRNIGVTATWGYRATVPLPLAGAVAAEVARLVIVGSQVALAGAGESKSIGSYSIDTAAGVSVWPQSSPIGVNHERFTEAMKMYRDPRALDRVRFGPAAVRALWGR